MKYILLLLLNLPYIGLSQEPLSYSGVIEVAGVSKDELYTRAKAWLNESFNSVKDVTQHSDKEAGEIFIKGIMPLTARYKYFGNQKDDISSKFMLNLWFKDGKYKYEIKEFDAYYTHNQSVKFGVLTTAEECPSKVFMTPPKIANQMWSSIKADAETTSKGLIASLEKAMKVDKKQDW